VISAAETSNKFQKTRLWKEKSLGPTGTGHTSMSQERPKITLKKEERKKKRDRRTSTLLYPVALISLR
jgi:hypothetical protein